MIHLCTLAIPCLFVLLRQICPLPIVQKWTHRSDWFPQHLWGFQNPSLTYPNLMSKHIKHIHRYVCTVSIFKYQCICFFQRSIFHHAKFPLGFPTGGVAMASLIQSQAEQSPLKKVMNSWWSHDDLLFYLLGGCYSVILMYMVQSAWRRCDNSYNSLPIHHMCLYDLFLLTMTQKHMVTSGKAWWA